MHMTANGNGRHGHEPESILNRVLKFIAYPASVLTGWWVTKNQVRHYTFEKLSKMGGLKDIREKYERDIAQVTTDGAQQLRRGIIEEFDLKKATQDLEREYTEAIRERMQKFKVNKLTRQNGYVYKPQSHKALLEGFTAGSIALGGLLILANSKSLARAFNDITDTGKDEEVPNQQRS